MISLTSEQDKAQLKEHALELLEKHNYEGLVTLVEVLNDTDFEFKDKNKALIWAAYRGYLGTIKYLVDHGADIHTDNDYALRWTAFDGYLEIVKYLVEHGADIHANNDFALRKASNNGHLDVVKYLVENGADIHVSNDYALRCAAENGHTKVVEYLQEVLKNDRAHK